MNDEGVCRTAPATQGMLITLGVVEVSVFGADISLKSK